MDIFTLKSGIKVTYIFVNLIFVISCLLRFPLKSLHGVLMFLQIFKKMVSFHTNQVLNTGNEEFSSSLGYGPG